MLTIWDLLFIILIVTDSVSQITSYCSAFQLNIITFYLWVLLNYLCLMWSCILQLSQINEVFGSWLCIIRFGDIDDEEERMSSVRYLLNLCVAAVETDKDTGTRFSTLLSSVCSYKTFPFNKDEDYYINHVQSDFLLDLCSHVMNYETQTGRSYLPALQSVFQSPDVWIINLSERKISVLLEVLKLLPVWVS